MSIERATRRRLRALSAAALAASALAALALPGGAGAASRARQAAVDPAFSGQAMWIWELAKSDGGDLTRIAARARENGIGAVYVKSADGSTAWDQFSALLVAQLHAAGLRVCAWQFVYGRSPYGEARAGALAASRGADCLIIDAESSYEGRYTAAGAYMRALRAAVGPQFPLGLTSFPYVDYHPALPYSVFLGSGGAQVNLPQVYWKDIGDPVALSLARTYRLNRVYQRPIHPIGQLYQAPTALDVQRFRALASAYGAPGLSWWDWQEAPGRLWSVLAQPIIDTPVVAPDPGWPLLARRSKGDLVLRAQRLLRAGGRLVRVSGVYDAKTTAAVGRLQLASALPVTGAIDAATWQKLLGLAPASPVLAAARPAAASRITGGVPASAGLGAVRQEVSGTRGAGGRSAARIYRGHTAERQAITLTVAAGRVTSVRLTVRRYRCSPEGDIGPLGVRVAASARITPSGRFGLRGGPLSERLRIDGRRSRTGMIRGSLSVRGTIGRGDACRSAHVRFSARRVR